MSRALSALSALTKVRLTIEEVGLCNGSKLPILMLHGLYGRGRNLRTVSDRIAALLPAHPVLTVDLRNHGSSEHHPEMTYPAMAADVARLIGFMGGKAIVVGHSMGGKTGMTLALHEPSIVKGLVVVDIAPTPYSIERDSFEVARILSKLPLSEVKTMHDAERLLLNDIPDINIRRFVLQNLTLSRTAPPSWKLNLPAILAHAHHLSGYNLEGTGRFDGPTRFLRGSKSDYIIEDIHGKAIYSLFPNASIVTLEANHWVHFDAPDGFVREVVSFVNSIE